MSWRYDVSSKTVRDEDNSLVCFVKFYNGAPVKDQDRRGKILGASAQLLEACELAARILEHDIPADTGDEAVNEALQGIYDEICAAIKQAGGHVP